MPTMPLINPGDPNTKVYFVTSSSLLSVLSYRVKTEMQLCRMNGISLPIRTLCPLCLCMGQQILEASLDTDSTPIRNARKTLQAI